MEKMPNLWPSHLWAYEPSPLFALHWKLARGRVDKQGDVRKCVVEPTSNQVQTRSDILNEDSSIYLQLIVEQAEIETMQRKDKDS